MNSLIYNKSGSYFKDVWGPYGPHGILRVNMNVFLSTGVFPKTKRSTTGAVPNILLKMFHSKIMLWIIGAKVLVAKLSFVL